MALINEHFLKLQNNYLFSDIAKKVNSFKVTHPKDKIIRMGIGDVTQPLAPAVIEAMHKAVEEMASKDTFHGYGPEQGYPFLIDAIIKNDDASRGVDCQCCCICNTVICLNKFYIKDSKFYFVTMCHNMALHVI